MGSRLGGLVGMRDGTSVLMNGDPSMPPPSSDMLFKISVTGLDPSPRNKEKQLLKPGKIIRYGYLLDKVVD
jgi:hypothetical protein